MFDPVFGAVVGTCFGYAVRSLISHRRRLVTKRRLILT
jgi:hypothetical protein